MFEGDDPNAACQVVIEPDVAWPLFTRGIRPEDVRPRVKVAEDESLGVQALQMVSIMA